MTDPCLHLQIDAAVEDLMAAVRELCSFHHRDGKSRAPPPRFLSDMAQDNFHDAEDLYLNALTAYTKKQFFKVKRFPSNKLFCITLP